jgi:hypothetical protein
MATTTKMAIPYPASTDLVKDGATNMQSLATQVDAKTGLVLLNTTTFTAVSSQSINDVFSATYSQYLIVPDMVGSTTSVEVGMRLRVSGADNSSAQYRKQQVYGSGASAGAVRTTGATSWTNVWGVQNNARPAVSFIISNPFTALITTAINTNSNFPDGNIDISSHGFSNDAATSYTGFTLLVGSGTFTGSVSIFGYNK